MEQGQYNVVLKTAKVLTLLFSKTIKFELFFSGPEYRLVGYITLLQCGENR